MVVSPPRGFLGSGWGYPVLMRFSVVLFPHPLSGAASEEGWGGSLQGLGARHALHTELQENRDLVEFTVQAYIAVPLRLCPVSCQLKIKQSTKSLRSGHG